MCKDQVRKKSSMLAFRNGFMLVDIPPAKVLGVCPNCLCRNCCTANRRQYCVIAIIDYTWWTPSLVQCLFWILVQGNVRSQEWTKTLDLLYFLDHLYFLCNHVLIHLNKTSEGSHLGVYDQPSLFPILFLILYQYLIITFPSCVIFGLEISRILASDIAIFFGILCIHY